ncbi:hypothetical protein, partial [Photobacterium swingsii]|uniref:hypothetical protein n=1 Tax=Photobacterium swingsii TaxID=680026 RepID=UPI0040682611
VPKARKGNSPKGASLRAVNPYLSATFKKGADLSAPFLHLAIVELDLNQIRAPRTLRHIQKSQFNCWLFYV